ncbi:MAG: putative transporter [Fibrobacter sp.]|uniref:putative transporter n=1 Tax=Fibrobacter sp. TaxID=35828 RepID=UPI002A90E31D|nr:putative transporter [Fibrobacter sp.]MDY6265489.1 putative transporter [Fibrobacter sp.]MDY6386018.1 putative transporter [Fibrobacter sp.]
MTWLIDLFTKPSVAQQVIAIALTASIGLMVGKIKVKGISLGGAGALFVGILLGHLGLRVEGNVLHFIQEFGLILFVYTIGMQVGPGFMDSIRRHGLVLNVLSTGIVLLGVITTLCLYFFTDMHNNVPVLIGMLCGAVTNTPSLGAANSAFAAAGVDTSLTGIGYAVAYPFGVIGIILVMILMRVIFRQNPAKAAENYAKDIAANAKEIESCSLTVDNPNLFGVTLKDIPDLISSGVVVTRLLRNGNITTPNGNTVIVEGDKLHIVGMPEAVAAMEKIIGHRLEKPITQETSNADKPIVVKTILVTNKKILGRTIESLALAERYGVNISRVVRSGFKFTGRLDLRIKFADKLRVVGTAEGIEAAEKELGNSLTALDHPEILPAFLGIFLGVIVGSIPLALPGMPTPLKLGLAGGPLIVAILLSRKRKIGPLNFFMANSANLMLREFGLTLFLSCVGLNAGIKFFDVLLNGDGLYYMGLAAIITFVPLAIMATVGHLVFKVNFLSLCGVLAGATTDPPALAFANSQADSEAVNIGYASVYPLTMLLRILSGQVLAILLLQAM